MFVTADLNGHLTLQEYMYINKNLHTALTLRSAGISSTIKLPKNFSEERNNINECVKELSVTFTVKVCCMLRSMHCYFDTYINSDFHQNMYILEQFVHNKVLNCDVKKKN